MFKVLSYLLFTVLTVDLLATSGDITMSWSSPVLTKLKSNDSNVNPFREPITKDEESWIGSLINIGSMIGPFPYGFIAGRFGRKVALLAIAIPHIVSYLTFAFSTSVYLYYFARLVGGLAVGGGYTILPMYVAEVAEDSNRGVYSTTLNIFWSLGNLIPYVIGPYTSIEIFNIILACAPTAFFVSFLLIAPESPYYLVMKNKTVEAEKVLNKLRSNNEKSIEDEINYIHNELNKNSEKVSFIEFLQTRTYLKGLIISMLVVMFQEFSGIGAVLFYTEEIFSSADGSLDPQISAMIIGFICFLASFVTLFVVDRLGRKILLLASLLGVTVSHLALGIYFFLQKSTDVDVSSISWLPIFSLVIFCMMYNLGLGSVPWTVSSELFPTNVKSYAATLVSCVCWTTSFIVTKFFNSLQDSIGTGQTFWLFGILCVCGFLFVFFFVPETKNKSFQEIQEIL